VVCVCCVCVLCVCGVCVVCVCMCVCSYKISRINFTQRDVTSK